MEANAMNFQKIQDVLDEAVRSGAIAGAVAAATDPVSTIFEIVAGRQSLDDPAPMQNDSIFWIASMTKALTSVAALQQVEAGALSLDAPLYELLPDLAPLQVLEGFDVDGKPQLRPAVGYITLRQLLTHTAGFSYEFSNPHLARYLKATKTPSAATGLWAGLRQPLMFDPGTSWEYGINTDWAGRAVEVASGLKLDVYFDKYITGPLGMRDTLFLPTPAQASRRAAMHARDANGRLKLISSEPRPAPEFLSGGGGLYSSAPDYLAFMRMILNNGGTLLQQDTVGMMCVNQIGALRAGVLGNANPALSYGVDFYPGADSKWSLGFLLNPAPGRYGRSAGSLAWAGLPNCYYWIDLHRKIAVVILMQLMPFGDPAAVQLHAAFEAAVYASL
ncbi:MAG: serine hydrolase [Acidocella sp.]|nr:serine hydrolase [Acidocella sp.]